MTHAVVITGAAGGIGAALCERMRSDGYLVIGIDCAGSPNADVDVALDLRDLGGLASVGRDLSAKYNLKAIVHNAATQPLAGAGDTPIHDWLDALTVNLLAVDTLVACTKEAIAGNRGSIVAVSSIHGRATTSGINAYATTKAALEGWVRSAAMDLGPGIRVNAVAPGAIATAKLEEGFARWGGTSAASRKAMLCERTPLGRIGEPSDVAGSVSFLIGEDAQFITGTVLLVDGGASARLGTE